MDEEEEETEEEAVVVEEEEEAPMLSSRPGLVSRLVLKLEFSIRKKKEPIVNSSSSNNSTLKKTLVDARCVSFFHGFFFWAVCNSLTTKVFVGNLPFHTSWQDLKGSSSSSLC